MMEHRVEFKAGYDCIRFQCKFKSDKCRPETGGSHGKHGLSIKFLSKGKEGVVQFEIFTGWLPQHSKRSEIGTIDIRDWGQQHMMPADLGYHSLTPQYDGQEPITESCPYLDDRPCYYDGSTINASLAMYTLVNGGEEALWKFLDEFYECIFNDGEFPVPAEYPFSRRQS